MENTPRLGRAPHLQQSSQTSTVDLLSLSKQTPILRGHVFKQSSHGLGHRFGLLSFKKRYFVLYEGVLLYYLHKSKFEKDLHHGLRAGKVILLDDLFLSHPSEHSTAHCFALHVPHMNNKRETYLLALSDRKSKNIWIEMLQQQNPQLEPPTSETDGHMKPLPAYIHKIRTLDKPSPVIRSQSHPLTTIHIKDLDNYHYSLHPHRRETWSGGRLNIFERNENLTKPAKRRSSLCSIDSITTDESSEHLTITDASLRRSVSYSHAVQLTG